MNMGKAIGSGLGVPENGRERTDTKVGELRLTIENLNEQVSIINKQIDSIEDLVFSPRPQECPMDEKTCSVSTIKTVNNELSSIHSRLLGSKIRLAEIREALEDQLDSNLRLL
jgi:hypothetical protein